MNKLENNRKKAQNSVITLYKMCVQYRWGGGGSVLWGYSVSWGIHEYRGYVLSTVGDIIGIVGGESVVI